MLLEEKIDHLDFREIKQYFGSSDDNYRDPSSSYTISNFHTTKPKYLKQKMGRNMIIAHIPLTEGSVTDDEFTFVDFRGLRPYLKIQVRNM